MSKLDEEGFPPPPEYLAVQKLEERKRQIRSRLFCEGVVFLNMVGDVTTNCGVVQVLRR